MLWLGSSVAAAQDYPSRPIKMIVPFAAGGPSDVAGRSMADAMGRNLKQSIIIENIGGAGGNIGAARAAQAAPDGYTLMFTNISMAVSPSLYTNLAYDPVRDFASIGIPVWALSMLIARYARIWVTRRSGGVGCRHFDDLDAIFKYNTSDDLGQLICALKSTPCC